MKMASSITSSQQSTKSLLAHYLEHVSDKLPVEDNGSMEIRKIPLKEKYKFDDYKTRKCTLDSGGKRTFGDLQKTLLMVGQTGAGKTTLIDGMFNYISGVKWKDNFRYKLTDLVAEEEKKVGDDTISHTEWITVYSLPLIDDNVVPYCVNIIDTPGFGDTRGIEYDKILIQNLTHFFNNHEGRHGVTSIDAICFVAKAPDGRLTPSQTYIFNSVMAIFGKNIGDNIFALATFSDGKKPKVYQAFEKCDIPIKKAFKFNNSALFTSNSCNPEKDNDSNSDDDEDDFELDKKYWDIGKASYKKFFSHLLKVEPKSTKETADLLKERLELEALLDNISKDISSGCHEMYRLESENNQLERHKEDMERNKDFEISSEVVIEREEPNVDGVKALFCTRCKTTCHYPCVKFEIFKFFCPVFNVHGHCSSCKRRTGAAGDKACKTVDHVLKDTHIITNREQQVTSYRKLMKEHYDQAKSKHDQQLSVMNKISNKYKEIKDKVGRQIEKAHVCYNRISALALREDPLTKIEFIDHLIDYEQAHQKEGYFKRQKSLCEIKQSVLYLEHAKDKSNPLESIQGKEKLAAFIKDCDLYKDQTNAAARVQGTSVGK